MKIQAAGITAEYNPFHNGHLWQLQALRRILGDVPVIVCMSGWFVQRGEPALADPWIRAEAAVRNGADLVLLLPSLYSLRSADFFAEGAVKLLAATGLIGTLVCSTEGGTSSGSRARLLARFCGVSPQSGSLYPLLQSILHECGLPCPATERELFQKLDECLHSIAAQEKTILLIDALNQSAGA